MTFPKNRMAKVDVLSIQSQVASALNHVLPEEFGAYKCTTKEGEEYVEVCNADHSTRFIVSIVEGL